MSFSFPPPSIESLERLMVTDGLMINAKLWQVAHDYHRRRQNIHFQSLQQPGIVCGLGVRLIAPPDNVSSVYRDNRWVQIQPGIAIDVFGNPIIVASAIDFRITTNPLPGESLLIYLVISYVDPDNLQSQEQREIVQETFRIDEKSVPPNDKEIEVCRILLHTGEDDEENKNKNLSLEIPQDVFFPGSNAIDLRFRQMVVSRPEGIVRVAVADNYNVACDQAVVNVGYLLRSLPGLYSFFQAETKVVKVNLESETEVNSILNCDVLWITEPHAMTIKEQEVENLKLYLASGGMILIEVPVKDTQIEKLQKIKLPLQDAIDGLNTSDGDIAGDKGNMRESLQAELAAIETELEDHYVNIYNYYNNLATNLGTQLKQGISRDNPLRSQPFLFANFKSVNDDTMEFLTGPGIMVIIGDLSSGWGLDELLSLSRETIRNAQELGVNILHYAWTRRQRVMLLK